MRRPEAAFDQKSQPGWDWALLNEQRHRYGKFLPLLKWRFMDRFLFRKFVLPEIIHMSQPYPVTTAYPPYSPAFSPASVCLSLMKHSSGFKIGNIRNVYKSAAKCCHHGGRILWTSSLQLCSSTAGELTSRTAYIPNVRTTSLSATAPANIATGVPANISTSTSTSTGHNCMPRLLKQSD